MNQTVNKPVLPGSVGKFFGGFKSGIFSGALMMGVLSLVSLTGLVGALPITMMVGTALTTGLFSGTMSVIRGGGHQAAAPAAQPAPRTARAPAQGIAQERAPEQALNESVAPSTKWADKVGQRQDRVQQILDRDMSDQNRAAAILAEREQAANSGRSF